MPGKQGKAWGCRPTYLPYLHPVQCKQAQRGYHIIIIIEGVVGVLGFSFSLEGTEGHHGI